MDSRYVFRRWTCALHSPEAYPTSERHLSENKVLTFTHLKAGDTIALLVKSQDGDEAKFCLAKELLEPFSSHYINLHLYLFLLDTVVANMRPDLVLEK